MVIQTKMKKSFISQHGVKLATLAAVGSLILFTVVMMLSFQSDKNLFNLWEAVIETENHLFSLRQDANRLQELEHRLSLGGVFYDKELGTAGHDLLKIPSLASLTERRMDLIDEVRESILNGDEKTASRLLRSREFEQTAKDLRDRLFDYEINERNRLQEKLATRVEFQERILEFDKAGIVLAVVLLISALVLVTFYIRQLKTFDRQLLNARNEAERASKMKSAFLANMSHEIRTPLNGVLGLSRLLAESNLNDQQRKLIESLEASGQTLMAVVNDILDLAKIESGKVEVAQLPFQISDIFEALRMSFIASAERKNLSLLFDHGLIDTNFLGDDLKIKQVLQNLISNAVKFTEQGEIRVSAKLMKKGMVRFEVRDSGAGIPEPALQRLFQPFEQADSSTSRLFGGTGLGLAICRHLVEAMSGRLGVQSKVALGSLFWFELPLAVATSAQLQDAGESLLSKNPGLNIAQTGGRVLLVEDNEINQAVVETFLKHRGWQVTPVQSGQEALEQVKGAHFDVILMDCHLPEMDGYEVSRRIRQGMAGEESRRVPIVALTASAMKGERERCLAAGMDDYLTKPVDLDRLLDSIGKYIGVRSTNLKAFPKLEKDLKQELEKIFLRQLDQRLKNIFQEANDKNWIGVAKAAHALKGSAAQLGFLQLANTCKILEERGFSQEVDGWEPLLKQIETESEEIRSQLEEELMQTSAKSI